MLSSSSCSLSAIFYQVGCSNLQCNLLLALMVYQLLSAHILMMFTCPYEPLEKNHSFILCSMTRYHYHNETLIIWISANKFLLNYKFSLITATHTLIHHDVLMYSLPQICSKEEKHTHHQTIQSKNCFNIKIRWFSQT